jgi:hypothetical protein
MAANVESFTSWSTTLTSNQPVAGDSADIISDLTKIQAEVRKYVATKGADIASATTTDLATATGNYVHITGTTTITGLGTVSAGVRFLLMFDGALTLTYNATSLLLPTAASITTAAGDRCEVVSLGSGNWRCLWYQRANGAPLDTELAAIAGLTSAADVVPRFTGSGTAEVYSLTSGTYTPTSSALSNLNSATPGVARYIRVGNVVTIAGDVAVDAVGAGITSFELTLPVATDVSGGGLCNGTGAILGVSSYSAVEVAGNTSTDNIKLSYAAAAGGARTLHYHATYLIV